MIIQTHVEQIQPYVFPGFIKKHSLICCSLCMAQSWPHSEHHRVLDSDLLTACGINVFCQQKSK